jgi:hypothetical protein
MKEIGEILRKPSNFPRNGGRNGFPRCLLAKGPGGFAFYPVFVKSSQTSVIVVDNWIVFVVLGGLESISIVLAAYVL